MNKTIYTSEADVISSLPGLICVKDIDFKVIALTHNCAQLCGWKNPEQAIGHTDYDMPSSTANLAESFIKLDQLSLSSSKKLHTIQVLCYESEWKIMLTERAPVVDENNIATKLYISAMDITSTRLNKGMLLLSTADSKIIGMKNKQANYIIDPEHRPLSLTEKQELCLFLLIRGKTMKQISHILGLSIKTVEDHLNLTKRKLDCYSKSQLIEKAIDSGFFHYIPKSFLKLVENVTSI